MKKYLKYIFLLVLFCFPLFPKASTRELRLYVRYNNNTEFTRYATITENNGVLGGLITHTSGSFPNTVGLSYNGFGFTSGKNYVISSTLVLETADAFNLPTYYNTTDRFYETADRIGNVNVSFVSRTTNSSGHYVTTYNINSDFTYPTNNTRDYVLVLAWFNINTRVYSANVTSYTVSQVSDNSDIINNNNQNTQQIINNINNASTTINNNLEDIENILTDDSLNSFPSGGGGGSYFDSIAQTSGTPISDLILLPYNFLNAIYNALRIGRCAPFDLGELYHNELKLPCLYLSNYLGSTVWSLIDSLFCIFMYYNIFSLGVRTYDKWTSLVDTFQDIFKGGM